MTTEAVTGFRLSPQQRALWAHRAASAADYAQALVRCGRRTPGEARDAWDALIRRHSILRTRFVLPEGLAAPLQVVPAIGGDYVWRTLEAPIRPRSVQRLLDEERAAAAESGKARVAAVHLVEGELALAVTLPGLMADGGSIAQIAREIVEPQVEPDAPPEYATAAALLDEIASELDAGDRLAGDRFWAAPAAAGACRIPWHRAHRRQSGPGCVTGDDGAIPAGRLTSCASTLNVSPAALISAAWSVVLARLCGWGTVRHGVVLDGRGDGFEGIAGPLDRVVPHAIDVDASQPFASLARRVEEALESARLPHVQATWDIHAEAAVPEPYVIEYERRSREVAMRRPALASAALWLVGVHTDEGLAFEGHYNGAALGGDAVARVIRYLHHVLAAAVADPERAAGTLPLVDEAQARRFVGGAHYMNHLPPPVYVHERLARHAREIPDRTAVMCGHESLTYAQLTRRANQLAHLLRAAGAGPEARVALCAERSASAIVAIAAVLKAGAAYVPIEPSQPGDRIRDLLAEAAPVAIVGDTLSLQRIGGVPAGVRAIDVDRDRALIAAQPADEPAAAVHPENLAYLMFTSGSTGRPKAVAVEHRHLARYVTEVSERLSLDECRSFAVVTTLAADLGHTAVFPALANGAVLHVIPATLAADAASLAAYMERHAIDCLKIVPSHLRALLDAPDPQRLIPRRVLVLGGEACPWALVRDVRTLAPHTHIVNHYGPTETTVGALSLMVHDRDADAGPETVPIGTPFAHAGALVVDEQLQPVPCGVPGELYICGETVSRGYFARPDLTAERFVPSVATGDSGARMYRTGDLVRRWEDGSIEYLRRIDRQIKIRGFRVEPGEIEAVLRAIDGVADAAVVLRDTPVPRLAAFVVPAPGVSLDGSGLKARLAETLPDHMVPATVRVLAALPITLNGKIDRAALARRHDDEVSGGIYVAPESEAEQAVAAIWSELLPGARIGLDDNFFDLGGHSLLMVQVHARLEQRFSRKLSMVDLFRHTTVRTIAAFLSAEPVLPVEPPAEAVATSVAAGRRLGLEELRARRSSSL